MPFLSETKACVPRPQDESHWLVLSLSRECTCDFCPCYPEVTEAVSLFLLKEQGRAGCETFVLQGDPNLSHALRFP